MRKRFKSTLALAAGLLALGSAAPAPAATTIDFGTIVVSADEIARLVVKRSPGPGLTTPCIGTVSLNSGTGFPSLSKPFRLSGVGTGWGVDYDPYGSAPPTAGHGLYPVTAQVAIEPYDIPAGQPAPAGYVSCEKRVSGAVLVLDRATRAIKRIDDTYTAIQ